jgi:hypothetical protein
MKSETDLTDRKHGDISMSKERSDAAGAARLRDRI